MKFNDSGRFNSPEECWVGSSLKAYLNTEFLSDFSVNERKKIIGDVFILNYKEIKKHIDILRTLTGNITDIWLRDIVRRGGNNEALVLRVLNSQLESKPLNQYANVLPAMYIDIKATEVSI